MCNILDGLIIMGKCILQCKYFLNYRLRNKEICKDTHPLFPFWAFWESDSKFFVISASKMRDWTKSRLPGNDIYITIDSFPMTYLYLIHISVNNLKGKLWTCIDKIQKYYQRTYWNTYRHAILYPFDLLRVLHVEYKDVLHEIFG